MTVSDGVSLSPRGGAGTGSGPLYIRLWLRMEGRRNGKE